MSGPTNGSNGASVADDTDPALPLLSLLRKHKARIAEYEQIVSEGQAALAEARRTFATAQRRIASELGLELDVVATAPTVVGEAPRPKWHRKNYKAVLASLQSDGASKAKALAIKLGITEGSASGACHRLVRDGKAIRIGHTYQAVRS